MTQNKTILTVLGFVLTGIGFLAVFLNLVWDNEEAAERFFTAMNTWLLKEFPEGKRENETSNGFSLINDEKFYEIQRDKECVHFILGLPEIDGRKWLGK